MNLIERMGSKHTSIWGRLLLHSVSSFHTPLSGPAGAGEGSLSRGREYVLGTSELGDALLSWVAEESFYLCESEGSKGTWLIFDETDDADDADGAEASSGRAED